MHHILAEKAAFIQGLWQYGEDFEQISIMIGTKSFSQVESYFYANKSKNTVASLLTKRQDALAGKTSSNVLPQLPQD